MTAAAVLGSLASAPALADDESGLWYFTDYGVQQAHDSGFRGQGVTVAIIDSPIYRDIPGLADANISVHEPSYCETLDNLGTRAPATSDNPKEASHGTQMALLIAGNGDSGKPGVPATLGVAPEAKINYYATSFHDIDLGTGFSPYTHCYRGNDEDSGLALSEAIRQAVDDGSDIISISLTTGTDKSIFDSVSYALQKGVVLVAGGSNDTIGDVGISTVNGVVSVQGETPEGLINAESAKKEPNITVVAPGYSILAINKSWETFTPGRGTSMATAITSGYLALVKSKYPESTGNQLAQTLINNTGNDDHELFYDPESYWGYGSVSLKHMLRSDPTQYPDVNPLFYKPHGRLIYDEVFESSSRSTKTAVPQEEEIGTDAAQPTLLIVSGIAAAIALAGGALVTLYMLRRKRKNTHSVQI